MGAQREKKTTTTSPLEKGQGGEEKEGGCFFTAESRGQTLSSGRNKKQKKLGQEVGEASTPNNRRSWRKTEGNIKKEQNCRPERTKSERDRGYAWLYWYSRGRGDERARPLIKKVKKNDVRP